MSTFAEILEALDWLQPELTVYVEAGRVAELQAQVDAAELPARVTVKAHPFVEPGKAFVVNETECRRSLREAAVRSLRAQR